MEKMTVLSTNRDNWPKIQKICIDAGVDVQEKKMDNYEWEFTVTGLDGSLATLRDELKKKAPKTICSQTYVFYKLLFTIDRSVEDLYDLLDEIGQKFHVDINRGHLSENGWHISIEDKKEVLEKIKAFLAEKKITASLF